MSPSVLLCQASIIPEAVECANQLACVNKLEDKITNYCGKCEDLLPEIIEKEKKIIFNTVPHVLLTKDILKELRKDVIIIDLASAPGGVDYEEGKKLGLNIIKALSLPGKLSPVTAGKAIYKSISNIIYDNKLSEGDN